MPFHKIDVSYVTATDFHEAVKYLLWVDRIPIAKMAGLGFDHNVAIIVVGIINNYLLKWR